MIKLKKFNEYLQTVSSTTTQISTKKYYEDDTITPVYPTKKQPPITIGNNSNIPIIENNITIDNDSDKTNTPLQYPKEYLEELQNINAQLQTIAQLLNKNDDIYKSLQTQFITQIALLEEKINTYTQQKQPKKDATKKKVVINRDEFGRITDAYITEDNNTIDTTTIVD